MSNKNNNTGLFTEGPILSKFIIFVIPVFISSLFTQIYNFTNTYIAGNLLDTLSLSAISAGSAITGFISMLTYGVGYGTNIVLAKQYGAKDDNIGSTIVSAIKISIYSGILVTLILEIFVPSIMRISNVQADIYEYVNIYLRIFLIGNFGMVLYNTVFFILRALGNSTKPLIYLIISCILNIVISVVLIKANLLGVSAIALGTVISQFVVDILVIKTLLDMMNEQNIKYDFRKFDKNTASQILIIGLPVSIQNMFLSLSNLMIQSTVNTFSNEAISGIAIGQRIISLIQIPIQSISTFALTFAAQNYGAKEYGRFKEGIRITSIITVIFAIIGTITGYFGASALVSLFNSDASIIAYGSEMVRISIFGLLGIYISHLLNGACRGTGDTLLPLIIAFSSQCVIRYVSAHILFNMGLETEAVSYSLMISFIAAGIGALLNYRFGRAYRKINESVNNV